MIYICIPSYNEAPTVGLLLWKIRQVFAAFPREYHLLVADDGSTDATSEVLEPYARVLPLSVVRHAERRGYAATIEELLTLAVERTDRPKRDCAILLHADFTHAPADIPELVKRIESGADLVVAEGALSGEPSRARRLLRRLAPRMLRSRVRAPGVRDVVSGYLAFRLITLRNALRAQRGALLSLDGWCANAELIGRTARLARRVETIPVIERHDLRRRPSRVDPWPMALEIWRSRRRLEIPPPPAEPAPSGARREAEAAVGEA
jgi:glycosyltransferase involved in cell wall biosynthesis